MKGMFLFGHIGITLGACALADGLANLPSTIKESRLVNSPWKSIASFISSSFGSLANFMDIRLLIIGSLLPDILDKPLGYFLKYGNGRSISHTLLVTLLVLIAAIVLYINRRKTWLMALAVGMVFHLILDNMWLSPETFLWPLYGWGFPPRINPDWLGNWLSLLINNILTEISEGIGLIILAIFIWVLMRRKKLIPFLIKGTIKVDD